MIPARGGSERIPRKNIREFAGKPIIGHVIDTARTSGLFERVIVSTDDDEISRIAKEFGAEVPFRRPAHLSDSHTNTTDVVAHAIGWLQAHENIQLSAVCCVYATAAFTRCDDLTRGLNILESGDWKFVFSATSFASSIFRSFQEDRNGGIRMLYPDQFNTRSQDHIEALHDAGQFYWGVPGAWASKVRIFEDHSTIVRIPRWRVHDIDTEEDWLRAEIIAASLGQAEFLELPSNDD